MSVEVTPKLLYGFTLDTDQMKEVIKGWDFKKLQDDCRGYNCEVPEPEDEENIDLFLGDFSDADLSGLIAHHYDLPEPEVLGSAYSGDIGNWFHARLGADDDADHPVIAVDSDSLSNLLGMISDSGLNVLPKWKLGTYWW